MTETEKAYRDEIRYRDNLCAALLALAIVLAVSALISALFYL